MFFLKSSYPQSSFYGCIFRFSSAFIRRLNGSQQHELKANTPDVCSLLLVIKWKTELKVNQSVLMHIKQPISKLLKLLSDMHFPLNELDYFCFCPNLFRGIYKPHWFKNPIDSAVRSSTVSNYLLIVWWEQAHWCKKGTNKLRLYQNLKTEDK